jgi:hypothetical protein
MGGLIAGLVRVLAGRVPDAESNARAAELATTPARWTAGHAVFDEVRRRLLVASKARDQAREWQYHFEESCCKARYHATEPPDPLDPSSAFFVVVQAMGMTRAFKIPLEPIAEVVSGGP